MTNSPASSSPSTGPSTGPSVSVVMSVFNGEQFLADAIDSILSQTFTDFEFIIVNDGSTDTTSEILRDYEAKDARIHVMEQENTGVTIALSRGCAQARGTYIARADADDLSLPTRIEKQVALLESDPSLVAATGDVEHFAQSDGRVLNVAKIRGDTRLIRLYNCFCNYIGGHGQVTYRRDAFERAGGYDAGVRLAQDYDLWTRLLRLGEFGVVPETVYRYRTGHDNITALRNEEQAYHSIRTCRREFKEMTGLPLSENIAFGLLCFWGRRRAELTPRSDTLAVSTAMRKGVSAFFKKYPDLRKEQYEVCRNIAAQWYWRTKEVAPFDLAYRGLFAINMCEWGIRALWSRARWNS